MGRKKKKERTLREKGKAMFSLRDRVQGEAVIGHLGVPGTRRRTSRGDGLESTILQSGRGE